VRVRRGTFIVRTLLALSALGVGLGLSGIARWGQSAESFVVERFEVHGNVVLTQREIQELSGIVTGSNLVSAGIAGIESSLASHPRIERAQASRALPDKIVVNVQEKLPAALVAIGDDDVEIAEDGTFLPRAARTPLVDLPAIIGARGTPEKGRITDSEEIMAALRLLRTAKRVSPDLWMEISEVRIAPGPSLVLCSAADGALVRIGPGACDHGVLARLWLVLCELRARGEDAESIDLRFRDQVIVRQKTG
jgi:cell division protein FtsQ